jgi:hypothetical protein
LGEIIVLHHKKFQDLNINKSYFGISAIHKLYKTEVAEDIYKKMKREVGILDCLAEIFKHT